jgi:hypothetical protein
MKVQHVQDEGKADGYGLFPISPRERALSRPPSTPSRPPFMNTEEEQGHDPN